ncbi:ATP-binding cassette domain-containing protein [Streptosporangium roseum]|uniref:ATP-binding cassette domain-containing protein n=1 Tax=Streptosporangium roseum TaxID=2001 RepID=UPI000B303A91|nr:excinuclease ABC subunit UvrA [Streptosporangium roseum]
MTDNEESNTIYGNIEIRNARENNLKNVSLDIPKRKITVFTGVSGSGKSSLVFGTIAAESQRLINETFTAFIQALLPRYGQPDADSLANLSAAIIVDQKRLGGNSRSTIGTVTDAYTMLRLLYSRLGRPSAGHSSAFSFNDPQGMCPDCEGLGRVSSIDVDALVDRDKSLNEGAIRFPTFAVDSWFWRIFTQSGFFDNDKKLGDYPQEERDKLLHMNEAKVKLSTGGGAINSKYEGLIPKFRRLYMSKDADQMAPHLRIAFEKIVTSAPCPLCGGARLNQAALGSLINGRNIAECAAMEVRSLAEFIRGIDEPALLPMLSALASRLDSLVYIGLGYLSLDRESSTLSGGESQRVKMVRHLGSSLTDMTYIFDEPSVGLHPHDIHRLNELLQQLRDKGNTVLVVEHKPAVIAVADHIVDMGPHAGRHGGDIVFQGDLAGLLKSGTLTGDHMNHHQTIKTDSRRPTGQLSIEHATLHNLRDVSVSIPEGVLTVVTGVAGSGKSSLIHGCLPERYPDAVFIDQNLPRGSKRSNPATYTGMLDLIRKAFASANKVNAALFSANSKGACPECQGLGLTYTDLAHMDPVATVCESCEGRRFTDEVLGYTLRGQNISEVLMFSVVEALEFFVEPRILATLRAMDDVGLGYITLGQPLSTLSGGERQRLKLAVELGNSSQIYVLDEPTTGLHMNDVDNLIGLLDRLVDNGSTVIVIEHNLDVISRADWIIDIGPGAGHDGGRVVFEGSPAGLIGHEESVTGRYLRGHATP